MLQNLNIQPSEQRVCDSEKIGETPDNLLQVLTYNLLTSVSSFLKGKPWLLKLLNEILKNTKVVCKPVIKVSVASLHCFLIFNESGNRST